MHHLIFTGFVEQIVFDIDPHYLIVILMFIQLEAASCSARGAVYAHSCISSHQPLQKCLPCSVRLSSPQTGRVGPSSRWGHVARCRAVLEDKGGAGILDRPDLDLSRLPTPQTDENFGAGAKDPSKKVGGGSYRVLLLNHEKHTEKQVVEAICTVVSGVTPEQALNCFNTAKQLGQAIITSCIKEHAEFYSEQLARQGVRNMIEPDSTVL